MSAEELQERVKNYSTPFLLDQYINQRDQYTTEAIVLIEQEITRRNITRSEIDDFSKKSLIGDDGATGNVEVRHFKRDDFFKLEGAFVRKDGFLLRAMFSEENIPFFMDASVQLQPGQQQQDAMQPFHVFVHKDEKDKAVSLVEAHFSLTGGMYSVNHSDIRERLKSFSFQEIPQSELDAADITDVGFSREEKDVLLRYARRLSEEIERIESAEGRIVFFFDNVDELISRMGDEKPSFSKTDLFTALEVLQIYCDDPQFPQSGFDIAHALLSFFMQ
jgi:hypothetical protein